MNKSSLIFQVLPHKLTHLIINVILSNITQLECYKEEVVALDSVDVRRKDTLLERGKKKKKGKKE